MKVLGVSLTIPGFNPTMVRLLQPASSKVLYPISFQSHNGAIAATYLPDFLPAIRQFQSHNGAIAAVESDYTIVNPNTFQSHNGAIAAECVAIALPTSRCFNPTMVRLLR